MSTDPLFSAEWYRVSDLKPWLASDVAAYRHVYRGVPCFVLHRRATGDHYRVDLPTYELIQALTGRISVDEVWRLGVERYDEKAPSQNEFLNLLADLHQAEIISIGRRLETDALFSRQQEKRSKDRRSRYTNPLYLRFPLFDPDKLLSKIQPAFSILFKRNILALWSISIVLVGMACLPDAAELVKGIDKTTFTDPSTLFFAILMWPILKAIHEFAHGVAVKHHGGEVHEVGVAVMVLFPIPYIDASASAVFPNKWHRIMVSSAGIMADITLCALALLVWSFTNGILSHLALVAVVMTGLSTLLFNGNPLLKFDGYYILADYLEIPNLAERSRSFIRSRVGNKVFGLKSATREVDRREGVWLSLYCVAASVYRFLLTLSIAWMLSAKFLLFGALLAIYAIFTSILWPTVGFFNRLWCNPSVSRTRLVTAAITFPIVAFVVLGLLPAPSVNTVQGVVWLPDDAIVRVDSECEIQAVHAVNGSSVREGQPLFECYNPYVSQNTRIILSERDELIAEQSGLLKDDIVRYQQIQQELESNSLRLKDAKNRESALVVFAKSNGQFVIEGEFELIGRMLPAGALVAYLIPETHTRTIRLALPESTSDAELAWQEIRIRARNSGGDLLTHTSHVTHLSEIATHHVPSTALTKIGGGDLKASVVDKHVQLDEPAFDVEIAWPVTADPLPIGSLVSVKLKGESKPLGAQWLRSWQRAFLGRVKV